MREGEKEDSAGAALSPWGGPGSGRPESTFGFLSVGVAETVSGFTSNMEKPGKQPVRLEIDSGFSDRNIATTCCLLLLFILCQIFQLKLR